MHTSGVRRMSGHTCDRQRPGHAVDSAAFPAASEDMGASSPCLTTPTHGRSVDWTCGRIRRMLGPVSELPREVRESSAIRFLTR